MAKWLICCLMMFGLARAGASEPLQVYLFASSTCLECKSIKADLFPKVQAHYQDAVRLTHVPVDDIEAVKLQFKYEELFGIENDESLKLFAGTKCLSGFDEITANLERVIGEEIAKGAATPSLEEVKAGMQPNAAKAESGDGLDIARKKFAEFKPTAIALAGLVDGINPCAFTTLIFFISLLTALKKGRREIAVVGLCFAAAIFGTYLALGLGALKTIKVVSVSTGISKIITLGVAGLTLVFAGYSFYDWFKYRRSGKSEDISLKLPDKLRTRVRTLISRQMRTRNLVIGALGLGVAISLLEAVCTGQVYLPTIMCVSRDPDLARAAVSYLVLYNFAFITPLLGVFSLAFCGVTSEKMAAFSKQNVGVIKIMLGVLFLGLSLLLIGTVV